MHLLFSAIFHFTPFRFAITCHGKEEKESFCMNVPRMWQFLRFYSLGFLDIKKARKYERKTKRVNPQRIDFFFLK